MSQATDKHVEQNRVNEHSDRTPGFCPGPLISILRFGFRHLAGCYEINHNYSILDHLLYLGP